VTLVIKWFHAGELAKSLTRLGIFFPFDDEHRQLVPFALLSFYFYFFPPEFCIEYLWRLCLNMALPPLYALNDNLIVLRLMTRRIQGAKKNMLRQGLSHGIFLYSMEDNVTFDSTLFEHLSYIPRMF
jgi:hypothetical protein